MADPSHNMNAETETAYFDAAAALAGLVPLPEHRADALAAFAVLMQHARVVLEFPLPAETEAAPRFSP